MRKLVVCAALISWTSAVSAFEIASYSWSYKPAPRYLSWSICGASFTKDEVAAIQAVADAWDIPGLLQITVEVDAACTVNTLYGECDGQNTIDKGPLDLTIPNAKSGTLGESVLCPAGAEIRSCDIRMAHDADFFAGAGKPPSNKYHFRTAFIHEMGHCIGLDHEKTLASSVMYKDLAKGVDKGGPTADDLAGRDKLYK